MGAAKRRHAPDAGRGVLAALVALVALAALGGVPTAAQARTDPPDAAGRAGEERGRPVTVEGVVERLVAVGTDGREAVRYLLRTDGPTFHLRTDRDLRTGARVRVTGTRAGLVLRATDVLVLAPPAARRTAARTPAATKILAMRVYWGASAPATPTTTDFRKAMITDANTWFAEVSHGRYAVSGAVTPWLKIRAPRACGDVDTIMTRALAAAKAKGFAVSTFGRRIVYEPCSMGWAAGLGSMPGPSIWLFKNTDLSVNVHEQGHNLGLDHANARACTRAGDPVTWSPRCSVHEYGDTADVMGNESTGHYNAYSKQKLGWLQQGATVTADATRTLTPAETTGPGLKGLRVKVSAARSYWLELRTPTGTDAGWVDGNYGVQLRLADRKASQLLDLAPGSFDPREWEEGDWGEFSESALPEGGSWTTPEGVRITVLDQTADNAEVTVDFGAGASTPPDAPGPVEATPLENAATVAWAQPDDNGALITKYVVTASPGDATRTVRTLGGTTTGTTLPNLPGGTAYTIAVRAYNEKGASVAATDTVTPINLSPAATISSPTGPQSGVVTVSGSATPNATSNAPIEEVDLLLDGSSWDTDREAPWSFQLDTRYLEDGDHPIRLRATDTNGKTGLSAVRTLTVDNPTATIAVTNPTAGAFLTTRERTVAFTASPATSWFESFEVRLGTETVGWAEPGQPLVADLSGVANGPYPLRVVGYVGWDDVRSAPVSVTVDLPARSVTFGTRPTAGSTVSGEEVAVDYTLTPADWPWDSVALEVEDEGQVAYATAGDAMTWDTTWLADGTYRIRLNAYDEDFDSWSSSWRTVTVANG